MWQAGGNENLEDVVSVHARHLPNEGSNSARFRPRKSPTPREARDNLSRLVSGECNKEFEDSRGDEVIATPSLTSLIDSLTTILVNRYLFRHADERMSI